MSRSVVDLPQPEGPSRATSRPGGAEKLTRSTAGVAPQLFVTPLNATSAMSLAAGPLLSDLTEDVGAQEALDHHHERDRGHEQDERRNRGDLVVAAHRGRVEQERQGRDLRHADEEGAGELVERLEEHEDRARHDAGRGEREGDGRKGAKPRGADVARRELEVAVDGGEGRGGDPNRVDE